MPLNHSSKYAELTEKQFGIIGRFVVEWSNIEYLLGVLLSRLLFTPEFLGRLYSGKMGASRIQSAIRKAIDIHKNRYGYKAVTAETLVEIEARNAEIEKFRGIRNRFAHFCWRRSSDEEIFGSGLSRFVPPSKKLNKDSVTLTLRELRETYDHAYELVERLSAVINKLPEFDE